MIPLAIKVLQCSQLWSVHFPGAVNSKFTTDLSFQRPATYPAIPTYRVMDSDGVIVDEDRPPNDVSEQEVVKWYKDMLTGKGGHGSHTLVVERVG